MSPNVGELEQECEDALFELCDVRERYPTKCANELEQCLQLTRHINMKPPRRNVIKELDNISIPDDQKILFQEVKRLNEDRSKKLKQRDQRLTKILSNIHDLRIVMEQIKNAELCPINSMMKCK